MTFEAWLRRTEKPVPMLPGGQTVDVEKALVMWVDEELEPLRQHLKRGKS